MLFGPRLDDLHPLHSVVKKKNQIKMMQIDMLRNFARAPINKSAAVINRGEQEETGLVCGLRQMLLHHILMDDGYKLESQMWW